MDIILYISRFFYRIRYQLVFGSLAITILVAYFSQFMGKNYTVSTSIYTGIASSTGLTTEEGRTDWQIIINTYDNLVSLTKSKGTLETVSLKLLALCLMHGNSEEDNLYITAKNYKQLIETTPEDILSLVDTASFDKTFESLKEYKYSDSRNYLQELFNGEEKFFSYAELSTIIINRQGNSDLIEIIYTSTDPGITWNTVKLISEEMKASYNHLRFQAANDIVKYYEEELRKVRMKLNQQENTLTDYNVANRVINYDEQTKAIANNYEYFATRYEEAEKNYESSTKLIADIEKYMFIRAKLITANEEFINTLEDITRISGKITEIETFTSEDRQAINEDLQEYRKDLKDSEKRIALLTNQINSYKESKEGVAIEGLVDEWLKQTLLQTKSKAELVVLNKRKQEFDNLYKTYSPVGTRIKQQEREINLSEQSYIQILYALNMAKMKQKNIQLTSATLNTISEPSYPLFSNKGKRLLLILAAFIGSLLFITGLNLIIELLDRTLRDAERAKRLTHMDILGAFTGRNSQLKFRGFIKACNRISAAYICNRLTPYLQKDKILCVNILSINPKEGKSFICRYLSDQWENLGFNVKYVKVEQDIPINAEFLTANNIEDYIHIKKRPDIILVEYPAIRQNGIPPCLLHSAQVNLLVANACRVWKRSDDEYVKYLREMTQNAPLFLYLNNASREAVEDFTGQLPPETTVRSFADQMMYLGLTSTSPAVK